MATFDLDAHAVFVVRIVTKRESLRGCGKFCAEPKRLELRKPGQIAAADSSWETKEIFDQRRGSRLSAGRITFQNNGAQPFRGSVNRRRQSGWSGTDDRQI